MKYKTILTGLTGKIRSKDMNTADIGDDVVMELTGSGKLPFVVLLPDSIGTDERPVSVGIADFCAELRFIKTINENQERHSMQMSMEDRRGELTYSEFQFVIISWNNLNAPINKHIVGEDGKICQKLVTQFALRFIKHFVFSYKVVLSPVKDWIDEVTVEFCSPWKDLEGVNIKKEKIWSCGCYDNRGTTVMAGNNLNERQRQILQRACMGRENDPTEHNFMQLANRARQRADWTSHIVYTHTAFEYWVFSSVRTFLFNKGLSKDEVDNELLDKPAKSRAVFKSKEKALKMVLGTANFKNWPEYTEYQINVADVRSSIIHVKATKLEKQDSENAAVAFENFNKKIAKEIKAKYTELNITDPKPLMHFLELDGSSIYDDSAYPRGR